MSHNVIPFRPRSLTPRGRLTAGRLATVTALPAVDPAWDRVAANIADNGLHLVHVGEGCGCGDCTAEPVPLPERYGYSVGLTAHGHPELVIRGEGARESADLLNRWGSKVLDGATFAEGDLLCEGPGGRRWVLVPVPRTSELLLWATRFYGTAGIRPLTALELLPTRAPCRCARCG